MTGLPPAGGCTGCAARDEAIAELGRAVEELRAEVADLRRRLGRNSGNSSMPPSADDLPGKVPPKRERRGGSARSRGKQPGAPGRSMAWAEPDEVIDHRPAGACGCGADLAQAEDLGVARSHQQLEVPLVTARRVLHDFHEARFPSRIGTRSSATADIGKLIDNETDLIAILGGVVIRTYVFMTPVHDRLDG